MLISLLPGFRHRVRLVTIEGVNHYRLNKGNVMTTNQPQRYGGLLGVAGGALALIGGATINTLDFLPVAGDAVASFTNDSSRILGGGQALVIGALCLAAFGAVVHRRIQTVASDSSLATMAATGYSLAGLAAGLAAAGLVGGALRVDEHGVITDAQATTMADISMLTLGGILPAVLALGVGATSIAGLRFLDVVPRWLAVIGLVISIGLVILPINYFVLPIGMLWTIVAGVALSSRDAEAIDVSERRVQTHVGV